MTKRQRHARRTISTRATKAAYQVTQATALLLVVGLQATQCVSLTAAVDEAQTPAARSSARIGETTAATDRDLMVSVVVQSEILEVLRDVPVRIGGEGVPWQRTDASGVTFAHRALRTPKVEVDIASSPVPGGVVLDQRLVLDVEDLSWAAQAELPTFVAHCTLPVAWDVVLPAREPTYARPWHDRWIVWPADDWVGAPAQVRIAHLGASETVRGHVLGRTGQSIDAALGVALLADAPIVLPPSGLALSIDVGSVADGAEKLSISTLQLVDEPPARASTLAAEVRGQRGRFWDVRLRGALQRGSNLLLLSSSKRVDRVVLTVAASALGRELNSASSGAANVLIADREASRDVERGLPGSDLARDAFESDSAQSAAPRVEPIANWPLPSCRESELESAWGAASAIEADNTEHQLTFFMNAPNSGGRPATQPWAFRVLWIGAPAVQVESGSWSRWGDGALTFETWSGVCNLDEQTQQHERLWFYRSQKRRITRWTITDDLGEATRHEATPHLTPRQVSSVCVQTSGVCSEFAEH